MTEISITNSQLNQMNTVLFEMRALRSRERTPVFSIEDIVVEWHELIDSTTSIEIITAILEEGAKIGFFRVAQCQDASLLYGYNANMLQMNPKNKDILLDAPAADRVCLEPCNKRIYPLCIFKTPVPSNCCFTQWKGSVTGGSISSTCGASLSTMMFMCSGQETLFC